MQRALWLLISVYMLVNFCLHMIVYTHTEWRRPIECLKLQVIFGKRATNYRTLLRKMTYKDKASYASSSPRTHSHSHMYTYVYIWLCVCIFVHTHMFADQWWPRQLRDLPGDSLRVPTQAHTNTHARVQTHSLTHTQIHTHTHIHTYTHTHTHTHTQIAHSVYPACISIYLYEVSLCQT